MKLGNALSANKDKFNPVESTSIDRLKSGSRVIVVLLVALLISIIFYHTNVPTPLIEWAVVLYYSNFFAIASYANGFYDSVHEDGTLIKKTN